MRSETLGLAFLAALQWLPASQRAVLVLREVHGYSASETATLLEMTATAVNSSLQRARRTLANHAHTTPHTARLEPARQAQLVGLYVEAWERGDIDAVLDLLTEDATMHMPPFATWFSGRSAIAEFLPTGPLTERWRLLPTEANGQPAFGCYAWDAVAGTFAPHSLDVVSIIGMRIHDITSFLHPELLTHFGLPKHLDPSCDQQTSSGG